MRNRLVLPVVMVGLSGLFVLTTPALAHGAPTHSHRPRAAPRRQQVVHRLNHPNPNQANPFPEMVSLSGRVTLPDGKPAGGAIVLLSWVTNSNQMRFHTIHADAQGRFGQSVHIGGTFSQVPAQQQPRLNMVALTASLPGKGIFWQRYSKAEQLIGMNLRLQRGATLTGHLVRLDGKPAANVPVRIQTLTPAIGRDFMDFQFLSVAQLFPDRETEPVYQAVTDASGRFTLNGVPNHCYASFALGNGLHLASGSMSPLDLGQTAHEDAGILVAAQSGGLKVRVLDRATGKPVPNVMIAITGDEASTQRFGFIGSQQTRQQLQEMAFRQVTTDARGEVTVQGLMPGGYRVMAQGAVVQATVAENRIGEPICLTHRQGALKGRLLDADGKPAANIGIVMNPGRNQVFMGEAPPSMQTAWENQPVAQTDPDGRFEIEQFPWGSQEVTVRATRGDDRAEWHGTPTQIGKDLKLQLTPDALVTVTGRLIDTQRRPITNVSAQALHWTSLPRGTWFGNAHTVQTDAEGRFKLSGLERGESFSVVTGNNQVGFVGNVVVGGSHRGVIVRNGLVVQGKTNTARTVLANFESPRFVTRAAVQQQDLGDVMVHPLEDGQQSQQIYSSEPPEEIARSFNLLPAPDAEGVAEARAVLARYVNAVRSGEVDLAMQLSSRVGGWSDQRETFLRNTLLRVSPTALAADPASLRAVRFVPRFAATSLIGVNTGRNSMFSSGPSISTELERYPDWVFLVADQGGKEAVAGVLRREDGKWRVVSDMLVHPFQSVENLLVLHINASPVSKSRTVSQPLTGEEQRSARQVGEQYLRLWAQDRPDAMLALTAAQSPDHALKLADYKLQFEGRVDEGACPLSAEENVTLRPVSDLTLSEQARLANFVAMRGQLTPKRRSNPQHLATAFVALNGLAENGDLSAWQYTAGGRAMLMLLAREKGKWQVVEPALPM
jgi:5-hydroxyisourate hydrolase-like protein (transthyretin family)